MKLGKEKSVILDMLLSIGLFLEVVVLMRLVGVPGLRFDILSSDGPSFIRFFASII